MGNTVTSGFRRLRWDGRLITPAIGTGSIRGATRGWMILRGVTHRSITDAGLRSADAGAGFPDRSLCRPCTRPLWLYSLAQAAAGVETLDGSLSVRAKSGCLLTTSARDT
jgi:hypothetical protein